MLQREFILLALLWVIPFAAHSQLDIPLDEWHLKAFEIFEKEGESAGVQAFREGMEVALEQQEYATYLLLLGELGSAYTYILGEPDSVIAVLSSVYELPFEPTSDDELTNLASIYVNLGYTYSLDLGRYADAFVPFQQAYEVYENQIQQRPLYRAQYVEKPLGNICTRLGDYPAAAVHLQTAVQIMETEEAYEQAASACSDLGLVYQNWERKDLARATYLQGLSYPNLGAYAQSLLLINYADFLLGEEEEPEALERLQSATAILAGAKEEEIPLKRRQALQAGIYEKQALIQSELGDYSAALASIENALETSVSYYETNRRREIAKLYNKYGQILVGAEQFEEAVRKHQTAIQCVIPSYQPASINELPSSEQFFAENVILESLEHLANTYMLWHESSKSVGLLENAMSCHQRMYEAEQHLQRIYRYESSKLLNLEESRRRNEQAIRVAYELFRNTGQESYLYQAFVFAERSRSKLLREALQRTQANDLAGLNSQVREEELALQQAVSEAEEERYRLISEEAADTIIQIAETQLLQARDDLYQWVRSLETKFPRYYQLRYADQVPSLVELREMLSSKEQLLEYFVGQENLYVFRLDQNSFVLQKFPLPVGLNERILTWRQQIETYQQAGQDRTALLAAYQKEAHQLYLDLVAPSLAPMQDVERLLIISSGILDLVPFEALLSRPANADTPISAYAFLLQDYTISYGYSASLQWFLHQLERAGQDMAGFAPSFNSSSGWATLSCSNNLLRGTIGAANGRILAGQEANINNFQQYAPQYRLLHLATHAQANPEQGDFSFVVFSDGQGGYDSLFAKDLYLYNLQAELVILSACETALGTLYNSEGVISLARAFHYAGARSVLTTLWRINEGANCHLLEQFYAALDSGMDKKEALRSAKLAYLETADTRAA
ncbi:MAG: CHAT domain-containing protein, partial [Bacteroidota bacterium]